MVVVDDDDQVEEEEEEVGLAKAKLQDEAEVAVAKERNLAEPKINI
jgi:hypothetical protein